MFRVGSLCFVYFSSPKFRTNMLKKCLKEVQFIAVLGDRGSKVKGNKDKG